MKSEDLPDDPRRNLRYDPTKARKAAKHPKRPGEKCRAEPGAQIPQIDRNRCEGKEDCVKVCPYGVFEVGRIKDDDFAALSFLGKLKSRAHGRLTAYTPRSDLCQACGLCVVACPEKAIELVRSDAGSDVT
jgi:NAD-dependent dihydropyrimidine dehydrogenase PreA subunit